MDKFPEVIQCETERQEYNEEPLCVIVSENLIYY